MDIQQSLLSFVLMGISVVAAYFLFRNNPRESLVARGPLFIVCFLIFFYIGFARLPLALPGMFERLLGHSVWAEFMPPAKINVTQAGGTWWLVRWSDPLRAAYFYVVLAECYGQYLILRGDVHGNRTRSPSLSAFLAGPHTSICLSRVFPSASEWRCHGGLA